MLPIDLAGRNALVTGATGELGRTMARTLAQAGANVAVHYLSNEAVARNLVDEIKATGRKALSVCGNVTDAAHVRAMREKAVDALGKIDIVVTNAVIQYKWTSVLEQSAADYESQFRSCVLQNVHFAQAFAPDMIKSRWGRFIGINTECSMQYWKGQSAYVSGKRGMDGVLRVLAREIGEHNITVNEVAPGWTISENRPDKGSDFERDYTDKIPLKRRGTDREIANVVTFLASDLASYITGAYIPVCGGNVMPCI